MSGEARHITNPEGGLWQAVLLQAVEEALHGPKNTYRLHRAREWQEARDYITTPSKDLEMVCSLAGVEMGAVVERMRQQLTQLTSSSLIECSAD